MDYQLRFDKNNKYFTQYKFVAKRKDEAEKKVSEESQLLQHTTIQLNTLQTRQAQLLKELKQVETEMEQLKNEKNNIEKDLKKSVQSLFHIQNFMETIKLSVFRENGHAQLILNYNHHHNHNLDILDDHRVLDKEENCILSFDAIIEHNNSNNHKNDVFFKNMRNDLCEGRSYTVVSDTPHDTFLYHLLTPFFEHQKKETTVISVSSVSLPDPLHSNNNNNRKQISLQDHLSSFPNNNNYQRWALPLLQLPQLLLDEPYTTHETENRENSKQYYYYNYFTPPETIVTSFQMTTKKDLETILQPLDNKNNSIDVLLLFVECVDEDGHKHKSVLRFISNHNNNHNSNSVMEYVRNVVENFNLISHNNMEEKYNVLRHINESFPIPTIVKDLLFPSFLGHCKTIIITNNNNKNENWIPFCLNCKKNIVYNDKYFHCYDEPPGLEALP